MEFNILKEAIKPMKDELLTVSHKLANFLLYYYEIKPTSSLGPIKTDTEL